jgi:hypothetical protein
MAQAIRMSFLTSRRVIWGWLQRMTRKPELVSVITPCMWEYDKNMIKYQTP